MPDKILKCRPDHDAAYREIKTTKIDVDCARFFIRLRLYASNEERRWAVMAWAVFPDVETQHGGEHRPIKSHQHVNSKSDIKAAVSALIMEVRREGFESQQSSDLAAASIFNSAVSKNEDIINDE